MTDTARFPLVTVVTPSFNQGSFIEETILSVLGQDYPNIEYLIIDGASTDCTIAILRKYEGRLFWVSEPDRGQSHAINKGFSMARGEILCWLNSDDTYEPGAIRTAVDFLVAHPDVAMVYGRVKVLSAHSRLMETKPAPKPFDLWSIVYWADGIDQASTFFRRHVVEDVGLLDENLNWCMDWDLWVRIGSKYKIAAIDVILASIKMYHGTKTTTGGLRRILEIVSVMRKYSCCSWKFGVIRAGSGAFHTLLKYSLPAMYAYCENVIYLFKKVSLDNFYCNFHGVYPDRWLGRRARFMFRQEPDRTAVQMLLELPDDQRLLPNSLMVEANGNCIAKINMPVSGRYEVTVPYDANGVKPTEIELRFSKALPCDDHRRRLTCKLLDVRHGA